VSLTAALTVFMSVLSSEISSCMAGIFGYVNLHIGYGLEHCTVLIKHLLGHESNVSYRVCVILGMDFVTHRSSI